MYSLSFAPNPGWTETYATQPEIRRYLRDVAQRFGVTARTRFGHDVLDASWDDGAQRWRLRTSAGDLTADVVVFGNGPLAEPRARDRSTRLFRRGHRPEKVADAIVRAVERRRAVVPVGVEAHMGWYLSRLAPVRAQDALVSLRARW